MKKTLLLTMLLALLLPWAINAEELTVYDGAATSSYIPFYGMYADTQGAASECVLAGDSLANMAGGQITSMTFYISTPASEAWTGVHQVYLGEIGESELTSIAGPDAYTIVYTGSFDATGTELTVTFDEPFAYSGGNLVIGTYVSVAGNWKSAYFSGVTQTINTACYRTSASGSASTSKFVPKTTFEYEAGGGIACERPSALEISEITTQGASIAWADGSGVYNLEYKKSSDTLWTALLSGTGDFSVDIDNLAPYTAYQVRVQSVCDEGTSGWRTANFSTLAGVPFLEAFSSSSLPAGWSMYTGLLDDVMSGTSTLTSGSGWNFGAGNNGVFDSHAYSNIYGASSQKWLVSPTILIEEDVQLTFDLALTKYSGSLQQPDPSAQSDDKFVVLASIDEGESWEILRQWDNQGSEDVYNEIACSAAGQSVVVDLSMYAGQGIRIAFYGESTVNGNGDNNIHIDNVSVDNVPLCEKPINLAVVEGSVSTNSVELEWQDDMAGTWLLQYKRSADEQWTALAEQVTENPFVLEGLDASSTYQIRIAAWCDPSDSASISGFTNPILVNTECGIMIVDEDHPFKENFESYASGNFTANCWTNEHISGGGSYIFNINTTSTGGNSTHQLQLPDMSSGTLTKLALPQMDLAGDNYQFVLDVYRNATGTSYTEEGIRVFVSADGEIEGATELAFISRNYTQTDGRLIPAESASGWYTYELPLGVSGECYIILQGESKYGSSTYMDNFKVEAMPSCLKPSLLAVDAISTNSIVLSWTPNGDEASWMLQYKDEADSVWTTLAEPVTAIPFELSELEPGTVYDVRVAAWCDTENLGDTSEFVLPIKVVTECLPMEVNAENRYIENFDAYEAGDNVLPVCWRGINTTVGSYKNYPKISQSSYSAHSGSNYLYFYSYHSSYTDYDPQPQYAILPAIDDLDNLQLTLWAKGYYSNTVLKIGRMSDPFDASTFELIASQTLPTSYAEFTFDLSGASGDYVALMIDAASASKTTNSVYVDDLSIHTPITCQKPAGLSVSNISSHTATISWTAGGEETAWQILLNGDSIVDADSNPFILTGLDSETIYSAKVRANCGEEVSEWANDSVRFTTLVACPVPDFRADSIKNIGAHSVDLAWGGDAGSYTVSYRTAAGATGISEGFEGGLGGWTLRDCNSSTDISSSDAHSGSNSFRFHYSYYPPQYLISPEMSATAENEVLSFYYKAESLTYQESFKVGYSSTDNATGSFTFGDEYITSDTLWHQFSEAVPAGTKFICIQYTAYDKYNLYIDDILIGEEIPAGEWVVSDNVEGNSLVLSDLQAETAYEVKIQANCGEEGMSGESAVISFRTLSDCETPKNFQLLALAADSAVISWSTFEQEEFNFRYHADGEEWIEVSGVTCPYTMTGLSAGTTYTIQVQAACNTEVWSDSAYFKTAYSVPFAPGEISSTVLAEEWIKASGLASDIFAGGQLQSSTSGWISSNANTLFDEAHLKLNIYGQDRYYWIISPAIDLSDVTLAADEKLKLAFTMARAKYSSSGDLTGMPDSTGVDDKFMVVFSTDNGATWSEANATTWSNEAGNPNIYNAIPNTGVDILLDFSAAAGHVMRFAFYGESVLSNADNDIHVGNILLDIVGNTTGMDAVMEEGKAMKFFLDGHIYIRINGKTFDTTGRLVK